MLCGKIPFKASNITDLHSLILSGTFDIPNDVSDYAKNLLSRMIVVEPTNRLTLEEILKHPWFLVKNSKIIDKSHPQFCPKILKENSVEEIKQSAVNSLVELGFSYDFVVRSLKNNEMNHATASYYLIT